MRMIGDARFVLLGEASHGTHEFYRERARITRRLIEEKGFTAVAVEGDWPDARRVHQYVQNAPGAAPTPEQALSGFAAEFPHWMWGNAYVRDLVTWLRQRNTARSAGTPHRVGVYGMDLYSLVESAEAVAQGLETIDPAAARRSRERFRSLTRFRSDPQAYGASVAANPAASLQRPAAEQFAEVQQLVGARMPKASPTAREELFSLVQNARIVKNAEEYYRTLYTGGMSSWNLRDKHMAETLNALTANLAAQGRQPKVVVWAHNTHAGDARVTEMGQKGGEWNVGQLLRQAHGKGAVSVGFTTYTGTVTAATEWGQPGRTMTVRPALPESYSALFHEAMGGRDFLLILRGAAEALSTAMGEPRLERAIGVVYLPETERQSHYFTARLSRQFDAVIHIDRSSAIKPLAPASQ
jgi:erythromycin esterase-like protein